MKTEPHRADGQDEPLPQETARVVENSPGSKHHRHWIGIAVTLCSAIFCYSFIDNGWIPQDDGFHAQTAERTMAGEMPHVDFDEMYTGGLSYLHGLGFRILGPSFYSIRFTQYLFFLSAVPPIYYLALRVVSAGYAFLFTILCVVWALPNFPVPTPNWYTLAFNLWGAVCLCGYLDRKSHWWLFAAGACGGLSVVIKITGLFFCAAATLFLIHHELCSQTARAGGKRGSTGLFSVLKTAALIMVVAANVMLIRRHFVPMEIIHFLLPNAFLCTMMIYAEWSNPTDGFAVRARRYGRLFVPCILGFFVPVGCFVLLYWSAGHIQELVYGVFVLPGKRLEFSTLPLPPARTLFVMVPVSIYFLIPMLPMKPAHIRRMLWVFAIPLIGVFILSFMPAVYRWTWFGLRGGAPLLATLAVCGIFWKGGWRHRRRQLNQTFFLLAAMLVFLSLVQYPWALPNYLLFFTPLTFLVGLFFLRLQYPRFSRSYLPLGAFLLLWAVVWVNGAHIFAQGWQPMKSGHTVRLNLPRGRVLVAPWEKQQYEELIDYIHSHSGAGPYILAFPDCPDVYFLSGKKNPTGITFDFFRDPWDSTDLIELLNEKKIQLVVIRKDVEFSRNHVTPQISAALASEFPESRDIGNFQILIRPPRQ